MARYEDTERNSGFTRDTLIRYLDETISLCEFAKQNVNGNDFDLDRFLRTLHDIIRLPSDLRVKIIENQKILDKYAKKKSK